MVRGAVRLLNEIPDDDHDAESLRSLASVEDSLGERKTARSLLERARESLADDRAGEAATWHNLASIDLNEGNYAGAREQFGKALAMRQAIGDRAGEAATWHQLASIDLEEGNYAGAREQFGKALAMRQAIGDRAGEAATWHQLATIDVHEGNYAGAREQFGKALAMRQAIGDRAGEAATWHQLASIDLRKGNYAAARDKCGKALTINQAIGNQAGEASTWHQLASIDLREGNNAAAEDKFGKALAMLQAIGDRVGEAATWHSLASIDLNEGNYAAARNKFGKALAMRQAIGDRAGEAATWHQLATIDVHEGNYAGAREQFGKALAMLQAIGDRAGEAAVSSQFGSLACKLGRNHDGARLIAICYLLDKAIGHGDAESDFRTLNGLCRSLGYDQAQDRCGAGGSRPGVPARPGPGTDRTGACGGGCAERGWPRRGFGTERAAWDAPQRLGGARVGETARAGGPVVTEIHRGEESKRSCGRVRRRLSACGSRRPLRRGRGRRRSSRAGRHRAGAGSLRLTFTPKPPATRLIPTPTTVGLPREYHLRPVPSPCVPCSRSALTIVGGPPTRCAGRGRTKRSPISSYCSRPLASCGANCHGSGRNSVEGEVDLQGVEDGAEGVGVGQPLAVRPALVATREEESDRPAGGVDNQRAAVAPQAEGVSPAPSISTWLSNRRKPLSK